MIIASQRVSGSEGEAQSSGRIVRSLPDSTSHMAWHQDLRLRFQGAIALIIALPHVLEAIEKGDLHSVSSGISTCLIVLILCSFAYCVKNYSLVKDGIQWIQITKDSNVMKLFYRNGSVTIARYDQDVNVADSWQYNKRIAGLHAFASSKQKSVLGLENTLDLMHGHPKMEIEFSVGLAYRYLLDDAIVAFHPILINQALKHELPMYDETLDFKNIEDYLETQTPDPCLLNVSRDDHAFLVEVKNRQDDQMEIALYESGGFLASKVNKESMITGKGVSCFRVSVAKKDLLPVLKQLHSKENIDAFINAVVDDLRLVALPLAKSQKLQVAGTCTLDCWLTYLKHNLDDHKFQDVRAHLFLKAFDFFQSEIEGGKYCVKATQKLKELVNTAKEKFCRRVVRYVNSLHKAGFTDAFEGRPFVGKGFDGHMNGELELATLPFSYDRFKEYRAWYENASYILKAHA